MKIFPSPVSNCSAQKRAHDYTEASALVIVLAIIVLITFFALAYFTRALNFRTSSGLKSQTLAARRIADFGMGTLISDLRDEMITNSIATNSVLLPVMATNSTVSPPRVYAPGIVPERVGTTDSFPNLVKRSDRASGFFTGGTLRASASASDSTPKRGRAISAKRWNTHYLLPRAAGASDDDSTPLAGYTVPDWIFVTRSGAGRLSDGSPITAAALSQMSSRSTGNTNYATGRYAVQVFAEGGLLDATFAGAPDAVSSGEKAAKRSLAMADLEAIGLDAAQQSLLSAWKYPATGVTATAFVDALKTRPDGFTRVGKTALAADRGFVSRQMLLAFWKANGLPFNALQYLGTSSFSLEAPSFFPDPARRKVNRSDPGPDDVVNPAVATITFPEDTTLPGGLTVKAGDPLVFRKFPLDRLLQILPDATAAKDPNVPIYRQFGIYRTSASDPWTYDHGAGTNRIYTLSEVAALNREPDFFELLQAGILTGSLGASTINDVAILNQNFDAQTAFHVLQIGANIFDQYDGDSIPSRVQFFGDPDQRIAYGVENLPAITEMTKVVYRPAATQGATRPRIGTWLQFEIWNPHQDAGSQPGGNYRILVDKGVSYIRLFVSGTFVSSSPLVAGVPVNFSTAPSFLEFSDSANRFTEPKILVPQMFAGTYGAPVVTGGSAGNIVVDSPVPVLANPPVTRDVYFAGILLGDLVAEDDRVPDGLANGDPTSESRNAAGVVFQEPLTISLQKDINGTWTTIQEIRDLFRDLQVTDARRSAFFTYPDRLLTHIGVGYIGYARMDPRTARFGLWGGDSPTPDANPSSTKFHQTIYPNLSAGWIYPNGNTTDKRVPHALVKNSVAGTYLYQRDPDAAGAAFNVSDLSTHPRPGDPGRMTFPEEDPTTAGSTTGRPVILNRAFTSVADLGYAFRDQPWKTLDFATRYSADGGLLDLFTVVSTDEPVAAGRVDLNTRNPEVLAAILSGVGRQGAVLGSPIPLASAKSMSYGIVAFTLQTPLLNMAGLPVLLEESLFDVNRAKTEREGVVRALAAVGQTRTWNFLVDIVAQSGSFPSSATSLDEFSVSAEVRYWVHLSIDRFTGKVVSEQWEWVYD